MFILPIIVVFFTMYLHSETNLDLKKLNEYTSCDSLKADLVKMI